MASLQEAVRLISSDRAKERSEGIAQYKDIFQHPETLASIGEGDRDGKRWLRTMQALFNCVISDKSACFKKGSWTDAAAVSLRRLKDSAQMVEWMVEMATAYYPAPAAMAVFDHLTDMLSHRGQLFEPVALDYLKALRVLLSYQPHMDHLDPESWKKATSLCFNILLNEEDLGYELDGSTLEEAFGTADLPSSSTPRHARMLDAEVTSLLHVLVAGPNAPLIGTSRLGAQVLVRYAAFFLDFPNHSTAHLPALQGLNHVLSVLEVNESRFVASFATQVWTSLLALWATKSRPIKEQVLITLRLLLPFVANDTGPGPRIASLLKKLLDEPTQRFAVHSLDLASVELCHSASEDVFQYSCLRAGQSFTVADTQTWTTLELAADCTLLLHSKGTSAETSEEEPNSRAGKRRKQSGGEAVFLPFDALSDLILRATNTGRGHDAKNVQLWGLQVLFFVILRYRKGEEIGREAWVGDVWPALLGLLGHADVEIQSWALMVIAILAPWPASQAACRQVWPIVCRKALQTATSRSASYAGHAILKSGHVLPKEVLTELSNIFSDLEMQGPSSAHDSICLFLTEALALLSEDISAVRQKPHEKALEWLKTVWLPLSLAEPPGRLGGAVQDPTDMVLLLSAVCGLSANGPWSRAKLRLPASSLVSRLRTEREVRPIRDVLLTGQLPVVQTYTERSSISPLRTTQQASRRGPERIEVQCLNFLQKYLKSSLLQCSEINVLTSATEEFLQRASGLAVTALLFNATLHLNGITSQTRLVESAHDLLCVCLKTMSNATRSNSAAASLMSVVTPLLKEEGIQESDPAIQKPGKQSGIQTEVLLQHLSEVHERKRDESEDGCFSPLWDSNRVPALLAALKDLYLWVDSKSKDGGSRSAQQEEDELWAGMQGASNGHTNPSASKIDADGLFVAYICLSALIDIPRWNDCKSQADKHVKSLILEGDSAIPTLLHSGRLLLNAVAGGSLCFTEEELEDVLNIIGDDILAQHMHERSPAAQILALDFLDATLLHWSIPTPSPSPLCKNALLLCNFFVKQLNKGTLVWLVESRLAAFLEHFLASSFDDNSPLADIQSPNSLSREAIIRSLIALNGRLETRLRWTAASRTARMFDFWARLDLDPLLLYEDTERILPKDTSSIEQMATRVLLFGNVLVASSRVRHVALYHLIELTLVEDDFNDVTESVLTLASTLLGFPSTRSLWQLFASQLTWAIAENNYSVGSVPHQVVGYRSRMEMLCDTFQPVTSMLVAMGTDIASNEFRTLVALSGKTEREGILECLPFLAATDLSFLVAGKDESRAFKKMTEEMTRRLQGDQKISKSIASSLDAIVVQILKLFYEPDPQDFLRRLSQANPICAEAMKELGTMAGPIGHEPCKPNSGGEIVYKSIMVLASQSKAALEAPTVYSVIHQMVHLIFTERMVNDQCRHLEALKLYLSLTRKVVDNSPVLLRLLFHSCAVLASRFDLVEMVWPLLDWSFNAVEGNIPGLSSSILLLLQHSRRYSRSGHEVFQQTGARLSDRLVRLVLQLNASEAGQNAAIEAACAWPDEHPHALVELRGEYDLLALTGALQATSTMSVNFLKRFVCALRRANEQDVQHFRSTTVWTLLKRLKGATLDEDERSEIASSFADLLYVCIGKISAPGNAHSQVELANHLSALTAVCAIDSSGLQPMQPLKSWLTQQLIRLSQSSDLGISMAAVSCLRSIFSHEPHFAGALSDWSPMDAEDLHLILHFPAPLSLRKRRTRAELESKEGLERAEELSSWIRWISELLCDLMADRENCVPLGQISPLLASNVAFASDTFSILVHIFLRSDLLQASSQRQDTHALSRHLMTVLRREEADKEVWRAIIQTFVQLRHDSPGQQPLDCDRWITNVDFFLLQQRATQCNLYATALLFAELEKEHKKEGSKQPETDTRLALEYEIYSNIDDPDSFYGIKNPEVRDSLVKRLQHEGQWDRLFGFVAAQHEGSNASLDGIAAALSHQGFHRLSLQVDEQQKLAYGAAWRIEKWDLPTQRVEPGTSQSLFAALRAVHRERNSVVIHQAIRRAFRIEYAGLAGANVEANKAARRSARDLLSLRETRQWQGDMTQQSERLSRDFDFEDAERLMSVRLSLLLSQRRRLETQQLGDIPDPGTVDVSQRETSLLVALSREARRASRLPIAINAITQAQRLSRDGQDAVVEEEFASLLWHLGDHAIAIEALASIVDGTKRSVPASRPLALARLGQWRATARSHQPQAIQQDCFQPAIALLSESSLSTQEKARVHYRYAIFAHEQCRILLQSPERDNLTAFIQHRKEEIEQIDAQMAKTNVKTAQHSKLRRARLQAVRIMELDKEKLRDCEESTTGFRREATLMYASTLTMADDYDDQAIVRLISLWFENATDVGLNGDLKAWLRDIASRKFLPFVHQISSRLSGANTRSSASLAASCPIFQRNVYETVLRMGVEHPFHSLYALYALTRADDAKEGRHQGSASRTTGRAPASSVPPSQLDRKAAASDIISRVRTTSLRPARIQEWEQVCDACVEWARFDLSVQMASVFGPNRERKSMGSKRHAIESRFNLAITKLRNVQVPVLTSRLAVDTTCKYDDFVSIVRYQRHFSTAGGVHLPKITDCIGSDGKTYRQLFKDQDDLRQDAVMQQVFGVLNGLLATDREAQKRELRVRTYAVIPLGPRYGLLEFVGNTSPIQVPLLATHEKYRNKGDIAPSEARLQISKFEGKTRAEQARNFKVVCALFPPAFRFHFLELHRVPIALLTNRLNYTRSVATTSIVGHILGLGDRHVSNILLDNATGEVVHIDFGVAFDQGKLLPIPELVPFRLTRDIVDAMGLHGVEGVFRRCCQETLRVLREGASVIETVLQVFKYDPLFDWTQNPVKVIRAQARSSQETASATLDNNQRRLSHHLQQGGGEARDMAQLLAERAIGTVMDKLSTSLSVEYMVNDLMMQAMDAANLGSIFHGWQAAL